MYISELKIENFRLFGENENAALLKLRPGLTAIIGENDSGKTAVVDALRLALGTRDQEYFRINDDDFHCSADGAQRSEIRIRCRFSGLTLFDAGAFAEYLTYEESDGIRAPIIFLNWKAVAIEKRARHRRYVSVEVRSGVDGDGPIFDMESRNLLCATYLRPLRDAERELSAGRGSRLSQILQYTDDINTAGVPYDPVAGMPADPSSLSILGIGDLANALLKEHVGLTSARDRLNEEYLKNLSFAGSDLSGNISVAAGDDAGRLRQLLEKLELQLQEVGSDHLPRNRGLGSNNILFMACELLLLGSEEEGFPILLIEEPEAHLHPQRQLRLMRFLQEKAQPNGSEHDIQIIVTTHSPNLASAVDLDNILLMQGGKSFSLAPGETNLSPSDYRFLQRFLDVTKANLFFARGVMIVEGDAENILIPTIAALIDRDLTESGVSIVNVGGTGFRRFARIFQRRDPAQDGEIGMPVACVADADVMPICAPEIVGKVKLGEGWPAKRRWKVESDFNDEELTQHKAAICSRATGQCVKTFVSKYWTLEYDLARAGLDRELYLAISLARKDEDIALNKVTAFGVSLRALREWKEFAEDVIPDDQRAAKIYAPLAKNSVSKTVTAQYLSQILMRKGLSHVRTSVEWKDIFPRYIVDAIEYVTVNPSVSGTANAVQDQVPE